MSIGMIMRSEPVFQDVDAMWEADAAAEWERINAPDIYEKEMRDAALDMRLAIELLDKAENYLMDAVCDVEGTPMEDKVNSLLNDLEDIHSSISMQEWKFRKGER